MSWMILTRHVGRSPLSQNLTCAFLVTSFFALRWQNCLPFSGFMPVLTGFDKVAAYGRYLLYAREPFAWPIGTIQGLGFPFELGHVSRATIPLFAISLKFLSKFYPPLAESFYFVAAELISVFVSAFFVFLILKILGITSFGSRALGVVVTTLSFPLLYRSSEYYGLTFVVTYFPVFLAAAYFYIRLCKMRDRKSMFMLASIFPTAVLSDMYPALALVIMIAILLFYHLMIFKCEGSKPNRERLFLVAGALLVGVILMFLMTKCLGSTGMLGDHKGNVLKRRHFEGNNYGGGFGGGFSVADALSVIIPPDNSANVPDHKRCGPGSYLTALGFPMTTRVYQDGQYEGFAYMGTIVMGILIFLLLKKVLHSLDRGKPRGTVFRSLVNESNQIPVALCLSTLFLYVMSWGYILHIGGVRFNDVPTPSFVLALIWRDFMYARALGRWAIPFVLFLNIAAVVGFGLWRERLPRSKRSVRLLSTAMVLLLIVAHLYEIRGYLKTREAVQNHEIVQVFDDTERVMLRDLLRDKNALMLVPWVKEDSVLWSKVGYALALRGGIPISGPDTGFGAPRSYRKVYKRDLNDIRTGNIRAIVDRYGDIAIAASAEQASSILSKTNVALESHPLKSQDVVILILANP